jgi:chromosome segregation ATPase
VDELNQQIRSKEMLVKELQDQLEMHSVGEAEISRQHAMERDKLKADLSRSKQDLDEVQLELAKCRDDYARIQVDYKESLRANERLVSHIQQDAESIHNQKAELATIRERYHDRERALEASEYQVQTLTTKVEQLEKMLNEENQVSRAVSEQVESKLRERNDLLHKIEFELVGVLHDGGVLSIKVN